MGQEQVITIMSDAIWTILIVALPMLGTGLVIGLVISIMQATTQIHEQTIVYVAKIFSTLLTIIFFGPWMLNQLQSFFIRMIEYMNTLVK